MSSELPPGTVIEPVFLVEAVYAADAAEVRPRYRPEHLARVMALREAGTIIEAGGCMDLSSAFLMYRAADAEAARALALEDVYMRCGVWVEIRVHPFGRVCRPDEVRS